MLAPRAGEPCGAASLHGALCPCRALHSRPEPAEPCAGPARHLGLDREHCLLSLTSRAPCKLSSNQVVSPLSMHAPIPHNSYFLSPFSKFLVPPPPSSSQVTSYFTENTEATKEKFPKLPTSHLLTHLHLDQTSSSSGINCPCFGLRQTPPLAQWVPSPLTYSRMWLQQFSPLFLHHLSSHPSGSSPSYTDILLNLATLNQINYKQILQASNSALSKHLR